MITKEALDLFEKTAFWGTLGRYAAKGLTGLGRGLGSAGKVLQNSPKLPNTMQGMGKDLQGASSYLRTVGRNVGTKAQAMKLMNPLSTKQKAGIGAGVVLTGAGMIGGAKSYNNTISDLKAPTSSDYPYHQQI